MVGCRFALKRSLLLLFGLPITLILILALFSPVLGRDNAGSIAIVVILVIVFTFALVSINRMRAQRKLSRGVSDNSEARSEQETERDDLN